MTGQVQKHDHNRYGEIIFPSVFIEYALLISLFVVCLMAVSLLLVVVVNLI